MRHGARGRARGLVSLVALAVVAGCGAPDGGATESSTEALSLPGPILATPSTVDASFVVTGLAHKCVDVGGEAYQAVGTAVFLYGCNGSVAQKVHVVEVADGTHDVSLRASKGLCFGVRGGVVAAGKALQLQTCNLANPAQRFALDGDAILVGTQASGRVRRDLVIEVQAGRGANHTPLVVGTRETDDAEDFRFAATTFAAPFPHSGFTLVASRVDLDRALTYSTWGTVIEVAAASTIFVDDQVRRDIGAGVTLRGERHGLDDGPEINRTSRGVKEGEEEVFRIMGDNVRITGLRFRGPTASEDRAELKVIGIRTDGYRELLLDHNELSAWPAAAVTSLGESFPDVPMCTTDSPAVQKVRAFRNYIHDNVQTGLGYGVETKHGGQALIVGNTFVHNRHAIASDGDGRTDYTATDNLVLSGNGREHDFDIHGTGNGGHLGGDAGGLFFMTANTFRHNGRTIDIRGTPCNKVFIRHNVFADARQNVIENNSTIASRVEIADDFFSAAPGTTTVGDFDGDGVLDDFIGTGAAWYYRPGRIKEWRFLRRAPEHVEQLTFGDFDGDGRTDVHAVNATDGVTDTSWGGSSPWDRPLVIRGGGGGANGPMLP